MTATSLFGTYTRPAGCRLQGPVLDGSAAKRGGHARAAGGRAHHGAAGHARARAAPPRAKGRGKVLLAAVVSCGGFSSDRLQLHGVNQPGWSRLGPACACPPPLHSLAMHVLLRGFHEQVTALRHRCTAPLPCPAGCKLCCDATHRSPSNRLPSCLPNRPPSPPARLPAHPACSGCCAAGAAALAGGGGCGAGPQPPQLLCAAASLAGGQHAARGGVVAGRWRWLMVLLGACASLQAVAVQ